MTIRQTLLTFLFALLPSVVAAQNASPSRPEEPRPPATVNVQVEVTIADYVGTAAPVKKSVSMIVADGTFGRIRAQYPPSPVAGPMLNVDATPRLQGGRIELRVALEYRAPGEAKSDEPSMPVNESLTVLLTSGKPLVVTQAADPTKDRRITVEVTATILK
jgi:hypothetical protein